MELLLFLGPGEFLPFITDGPQGDLNISILDSDIVAILPFPGKLEKVGDPIIVIVGPEIYQQGHGQLRGEDVAGDSQQLPILRIIREHDHIIHPERKLGVCLVRLLAYDLCIVEAL